MKPNGPTPQSEKRQFKKENGVKDICGTPFLEHYRETGELPKDEAMRKLFQIMIERGEV